MATIRKLKNGKYCVDYCIGNLRTRPEFDTKGEAERFKRELLLLPVERLTGYQRIKMVRTDEAIQKYIAEVTSKKSPATQILEKKILTDFDAVFGSHALQAITFELLDLYQSDLRKRLAPSTINRTFNIIRHFLNRCVLWQFLPDSPGKSLKNLKDDRQKVIRVLSHDQIQKIIASAQPWLSDLVYFMAQTGVRRKEACSIRWNSVDFQMRTFSIESHEDFHPKGYRPRTIPMSGSIYQFLLDKRNQALEQKRFAPNANVNTFEDGSAIHPERVTRALNRLGPRIGIPKLGPHLLRHTFCSQLVMTNESVEKIRRIAGHSSLRTTERYLHLVPSDLIESMEKASNAFKLSR